jgi:peptide-methionine (R)-S-oxide reductase
MEAATEPAFTGIYWDHLGDGVYRCVVCREPLFDSRAKFDSRTGWPSFSDVLAQGRVATREDRTHGMVGTEALCGNCGAHWGTSFPTVSVPQGYGTASTPRRSTLVRGQRSQTGDNAQK